MARGGAAAGGGIGAELGGVTVVTVSRGSWGCDVVGLVLGALLVVVLGGAVACGVVEITVRGAGGPTVALVVALSPLLMMTAVATAPRASTAPRIATTGRHRRSAGQANSS